MKSITIMMDPSVDTHRNSTTINVDPNVVDVRFGEDGLKFVETACRVLNDDEISSSTITKRSE